MCAKNVTAWIAERKKCPSGAITELLRILIGATKSLEALTLCRLRSSASQLVHPRSGLPRSLVQGTNGNRCVQGTAAGRSPRQRDWFASNSLASVAATTLLPALRRPLSALFLPTLDCSPNSGLGTTSIYNTYIVYPSEKY